MKTLGTVRNLLLRYTNENYQKDTNYDIAIAIINVYDRIPSISINELAELCFVSPATITRFIKHLGFSTFGEFKDLCKNDISIDVDYSNLTSKGEKTYIESYKESVISNIEDMWVNISEDKLKEISKNIHKCETLVFFGLEFSTILGQHFQSRMILMNKFVKIGLSLQEQVKIAESLNENSFVIIASVDGGYLYRNMKVYDILKEKNVKILLLTKDSNNKLNSIANETIVCGIKNENTEGRISLLYAIELIIMSYYNLYGNKIN